MYTMENLKQYYSVKRKLYSAEGVKSTGLPYFDGNKWFNVEDLNEKLVLVSKTTAKKLKQPVEENEPIAGWKRCMHGYCPLFKRDAEGKIAKEFIYILGD